MARNWDFLSNHTQVLLLICQETVPSTTTLAAQLGIDRRQVIHILDQLEERGYITRQREGRGVVVYTVHRDRPLGVTVCPAATIGDLLRVLGAEGQERKQDKNEKERHP